MADPAVHLVEGRFTINNDQQAVSPTGSVVIPNWLVPYFLAGAGALAIVGDEVAENLRQATTRRIVWAH